MAIALWGDPMKLALFKGKGLIGNALIRWWKRSKYSHCELVIGDLCYSSSLMDGGVRCKHIDITPDKWDLLEIPWANERMVQTYFDRTEGQAYSWASVIASQFFASEFDEPKASFCSEWCAAALGLPTPVIQSPESLGALIQYLNRFRQKGN